ncbi:MAG: zinc-ribbon domain-containing protein [Myxococcaceae bacterium]
MEVHCERCGTSYSLDEARLGAAGARVRCARCGEVFLVQRPAEGTVAGASAPSRPAAPEGLRREWRVRRRDGSLSMLRELTTLQRWIVEGKLSREDEVGLDGENWRPLGSIADLQLFFSAADALVRVAALEAAALARPPPAAASPPADVPTAPVSAEPVRSPPPTPKPPPVLAPVPPPTQETPAASLVGRRLSVGAAEPAFTQSAVGLGVVAATDDWEPPKLRRGLGGPLLLVLLGLALVAGGVWAYFYLWLPEAQRERAEQARNSQLERDQADHEARQKAAEARAKQELLQSLAANAAQDAGPAARADAGALPQGLREVAPPDGPTPTPKSTPALPARAIAPSPGTPEGASASPAAPPKVRPSGPQTFEEWMAEATRRRTHERAAGALSAYDRALELQPLSAEAHTGRGLALLDLGRRHEGLVEFHRALELDPRDGVAVLGLAETYRSLGRVEEARGAYQRYLEGWPGSSEAGAARAALESLKE